MSELKHLLNIFGKSEFDVDRFVKRIVENQEIEDMLNKLSHLSMMVHQQVQSTVFNNYQFFSKIGKLTAHMETMMPQIHNDFTEKGRLINSLADLSLFGTTRGANQSVVNALSNQEETKSINGESSVTLHNNQTNQGKLSQYAGKSISEIMKIVDGPIGVSRTPDRRVIFDGGLRELSTDNFTFLQTVHVFLLTDCLIVTFNHLDRHSAYHYHLHAIYDLFNVAVEKLHGRDRSDRRHAPQHTFKLKVEPAHRVFEATSRNEQSAWIRIIDEAKTACRDSQRLSSLTISRPQDSRSRSSSINSKADRSTRHEDSASRLGLDASEDEDRVSAYALAPDRVSAGAFGAALQALSVTLPECADLVADAGHGAANANTLSDFPSRMNPFDEESGAISHQKQNKSPGGSQNRLDSRTSGKSPTSWLWQVPDDLNVAIAERNFARATKLVVEAVHEIEKVLASLALPNADVSVGTRESVGKHSSSGLVDSESREAWEDLLRRVRLNESNLVEALQYDLTTTADRRGATRVVKATVAQLSQLGKANLAAQLFLVYRSNLLTRSLNRGMRQEASQLVFFFRLSMIFHRELVEACVDWRQSVVLPMTASVGRRRRTEQLYNLMFHSWLLEEAGKFGRRLYVLFLDSRFMSFHIVGQATHRIRAHAEKVAELLGADIFPAMFGSLLRVLRHTGEEQALCLRDAIENRYETEKWEPVTIGAAKEMHGHYAKELYDMGLLNTQEFTEASPPLTVDACQLIRSLYQFVQTIGRLDCAEAVHFIKLFCGIVQTERGSYKAALASVGKRKETERQRTIMKNNYGFFNHRVLPVLIRQLHAPSSPELNAIIASIKKPVRQ